MLTGLRLNATKEYISEQDEAKGTPTENEDATIFTIGTISRRVAVYIKDKTTSFRSDEDAGEAGMVADFKMNLVAYETVRFGLRGWKNFKDADGNPIPFKTEKEELANGTYDVVTAKCLDAIPYDVMLELSGQINEINEVSKKEEDKSEDGVPVEPAPSGEGLLSVPAEG